MFNKFVSNQLVSDNTKFLQQRIKGWMVVVDRGGPVPNDTFDYSFDELFSLHPKAVDPEIQELAKLFRNRHTNPKK